MPQIANLFVAIAALVHIILSPSFPHQITGNQGCRRDRPFL
ncbi:hypothetical protein QUA35_18320 [Microcoleus sp. N9_B2]